MTSARRPLPRWRRVCVARAGDAWPQWSIADDGQAGALL